MLKRKPRKHTVEANQYDYWSTVSITKSALLLFDGNKVKMARKSGKKQKENLVGCTGEDKR